MRKNLPLPDSRIGSLTAIPYEAVKWELLKTAVTLGVFDCLSESTTADDVASDLATHPANTEHLLNALVAIGCLSKRNGRFQNTALAESFLKSGSDVSIGGSLLFLNMWIESVLNGGMLKMVRNGPPSARNAADESVWEEGARGSVNHSRSGRAQGIAAQVSSLPEFASFSKILDMGAGPGIMGIAVAAAHPSLKCYLFDQAAVCRVADEVVVEYGMADRVETLCGDYMTDPIGEGYDFVMANFTLNFYRDRLDEILAKVYRSLKPGGVFMVTSDGLTAEKTAPAATVISWLATSLQGMDMSFERGVIADAMLRAGFVSTQSQMLDDVELGAHGPVDMIVGRKQSARDL